ncbi:MAG: Arc family DNA-binding protein [Oscillospiraceae bacterium]|jgi:predicted transcriptional regulator|nr:Arc family DNA-binding protein [Oscillospiraceae bacterium]MCI8715927.1 Arc family DNA-binding protein [Oscillospiraceae bacterium]MCI9316679.1 Arc family DNA-binding protein [Oscillospiraceae bacterium]MDE6935793.1 Arc family DNA-binding protein [Oscillospiraceae bacterium]
MERPEMSRFTLRLSQELLDKLGYIAEYNDRTKNKELERMIRGRVNAFEKKNGPIELEKKD